MIANTANHRVKKLLLACCLGAATVVAQAYPGHGGRTPPEPAALAGRMQTSLQLSEAQTKQITSIFEASAQQRKALEQKYKIAERDAFMADLKTLREQTRAKIDTVLTEPQKQARDAQRQRWAEHRGQHGKRHHHRHWERDGALPAKPQPAPANAG